MSLTPPITPERLALFTLEAGTAKPIAHVPVYAEVVVRAEVNEPPVDADPSFGDAILIALRADAPENIAVPQPLQRLTDLFAQELARQLGPTAHSMLKGGAADFIAQVIKRGRAALGGTPLRSIDTDALKQVLRAAIREEAGRRGLQLESSPSSTPTLWAYALGVLGTDHAGYASFDLTRLPPPILSAVSTAIETRRRDPAAVLDISIAVYPSGSPGSTTTAFDALAQGRIAGGAIVARIEIAKADLPEPAIGLTLPAMQNPALEDWRLSPTSFATNPGSLIGADGCETILPANLALQQFYFYQVVRLTDLEPLIAPTVPGQVRLGFVNEYRLAWYPLGHSLGQILYSLPLAPGESVNIAVIDWTRRDESQRKERTTVDEQLVHNEHRDRTIGETVTAAVHEYQHGSSFMGGIAGAVGGSTGAVSGGIAGSLGGSTSNSSGARDISGSTVQKLSDNISQASSAMRELQSTVVVQSNQSEKEAIETRTVVNYNHSHALTILYYEVLRHFRIVTELVRRRPAILVKVRTDWFEGAGALNEVVEHRAVLATALLDTRFADGFDAAQRLVLRGGPLADLTTPLPPATPAPAPDPNPPPLFHYFTFEMRTGGFYRPIDDHSAHIDILASLLLQGGGTADLVRVSGNSVLNNFGAFSQADTTNIFTAMPKGRDTVSWASIIGMRIGIVVFPTDDDTAKVSFSHIKVTGIDAAGVPGTVLIDQGYEAGHLIFTNGNDEAGRDITLPAKRPAFAPPPPPQFPDDGLVDRSRSAALVAHLERHRHFYSRAIALGQEAFERSADLEGVTFSDGSSAFDHVENRPLELVGDYLAYPSNDTSLSAVIEAHLDGGSDNRINSFSILEERLVTLPTRGVFAEAKLGHCNASEVIDNTRFWDWQQSPIPHFAPEIAPTVPVTPHPVQENLAPTNFPSSIVNIVNPPNAPDPTGLAGALNVLASPNIFRDMSGRAEVADILKNLADNAVKVAGIASAGQARSGGGAGSGGASSTGSGGSATRPAGSGGTSIGGARAMPNQPSANNRDLQDFGNVLSGGKAKGLITPEAAQSAFTDAATGGALDLQRVGDSYQRPAYTVQELVAIIGERITENALKGQSHVVFSDWRKHVSGTGFDMVSYDPVAGELWIIDNKAQFRGIAGANALTGSAYGKYEADLRAFLKDTWPVKAEANLALAALDAKKVKLVVSNGFAGEATRFTAGLFEKGLYAFDIRVGKLFASHAAWKTMYDGLALKKGVRLTGVRGAALVEANLLVTAVALGAGMYMLSSGMNLKELGSDIAAQFAVDTLLSRLPGGAFAAFVIGMESDESPGQRQTRILNEQIDAIMYRIPGIDTLPDADKSASRDAVRAILLDPIIVEDPTANNPKQLLPGFTNPNDRPGTWDA